MLVKAQDIVEIPHMATLLGILVDSNNLSKPQVVYKGKTKFLAFTLLSRKEKVEKMVKRRAENEGRKIEIQWEGIMETKTET